MGKNCCANGHLLEPGKVTERFHRGGPEQKSHVPTAKLPPGGVRKEFGWKAGIKSTIFPCAIGKWEGGSKSSLKRRLTKTAMQKKALLNLIKSDTTFVFKK